MFALLLNKSQQTAKIIWGVNGLKVSLGWAERWPSHSSVLSCLVVPSTHVGTREVQVTRCRRKSEDLSHLCNLVQVPSWHPALWMRPKTPAELKTAEFDNPNLANIPLCLLVVGHGTDVDHCKHGLFARGIAEIACPDQRSLPQTFACATQKQKFHSFCASVLYFHTFLPKTPPLILQWTAGH